MLRRNLLLTTAFVVATALSSLAAPTATLAGPATAALSRDSNNEFLQNYSCGQGQFAVYASSGELSSNHVSSRWQYVAVPVLGRGTTVDSIVVREGAPYSYLGDVFSVGIFSNTASGFPGREIADGTAKLRENHCFNTENKTDAKDKILDRGKHDVAVLFVRQRRGLATGAAYQAQGVCTDPHREPGVFQFSQLHEPVDEAIGRAVFPAEIGEFRFDEGKRKCSAKAFCLPRPSWSLPRC